MEASTTSQGDEWPSVTIVFLVYNRRDELRTSLRQMLLGSDYPSELVDVVVVDNASEDGAAEMVEQEFPQVQLIRRSVNCGVSGWNDGFAVARGEYVLALDDDCYLPGDGLRRAVAGARDRGAQLVSFGVSASEDPEHRFDASYQTGLLSFWGCAALMHRTVLEQLGGYDPQIFVWANELEFTLRFFDRGMTHLHLPHVVAVHMKPLTGTWIDYFSSRAYRINARHFAYIAAKLFRPIDALAALVALLAHGVRDGLRVDRQAFRAIPGVVSGFARGLRHREPLRNPRISRVYRHNFHSYASPWWFSRPVAEIVSSGLRQDGSQGRRQQYFADRARYYPSEAATLEF